uniref:Uncharacterized protein n=1 Tax=Cajanus cajan TaxID=3821 RepID=A0A151QWS0_CAJCA|nr:hypothetical protein KK1_044238 [Cajanus cajan]
MANSSWRLIFPHGLVKVINPHGLDHNPLMAHYFKSPTAKSKSFHFQATWILHPNFRNLVSQTWLTT